MARGRRVKNHKEKVEKRRNVRRSGGRHVEGMWTCRKPEAAGGSRKRCRRLRSMLSPVSVDMKRSKTSGWSKPFAFERTMQEYNNLLLVSTVRDSLEIRSTSFCYLERFVETQ